MSGKRQFSDFLPNYDQSDFGGINTAANDALEHYIFQKLLTINDNKLVRNVLTIKNYGDGYEEIIDSLFEYNLIETVIIKLDNNNNKKILNKLQNGIKELHLKGKLCDKSINDYLCNLPHTLEVLVIDELYDDSALFYFHLSLKVLIINKYYSEKLEIPEHITYLKICSVIDNKLSNLIIISDSLIYLEICEGYEGKNIKSQIDKLPNLRYCYLRGSTQIITKGIIMTGYNIESFLWYHLKNNDIYIEYIIDGKTNILDNESLKINKKDKLNEEKKMDIIIL